MEKGIVVSSIIDKLPPSMKEYSKILKHNKEEIIVEQLGQHFHIEEELRPKMKNTEFYPRKCTWWWKVLLNNPLSQIIINKSKPNQKRMNLKNHNQKP